jgi:hypothetical protein
VRLTDRARRKRLRVNRFHVGLDVSYLDSSDSLAGGYVDNLNPSTNTFGPGIRKRRFYGWQMAEGAVKRDATAVSPSEAENDAASFRNIVQLGRNPHGGISAIRLWRRL